MAPTEVILPGSPLSRSQFVDITANGTNTGMPPFQSTYNTTEIDAIADYVLSLAAPTTTTTTTIPGSPPPPPPSGAAVYAGSCAACHGASGGDLVGRSMTTGQISVAVNNGAPGMPGFSTRLSTTEVNAVVAYVAGKAASGPATTTTTEPGSPPPNGAAVYAESCAVCHPLITANSPRRHDPGDPERRCLDAGGLNSRLKHVAAWE